MRIAHFAVFSPNLAGIYATVKDLIIAERLQGIDARFVDYSVDANGKAYSKVGYQDESIISMSPDWAYKHADIIVRHSMVTEPISRVGIPMIMAMHGRPEYSFLLEHYGKTPVMKIMCNHETDNKYHAYISFWKEHKLFWSTMMPDREIHYLPSVVDLEKFNPDGEKYNFGNKSGSPNILICDMWREDITPLNTIMAAVRFKERYCPTAKIQLFGLPPAGKGFISEFAERLNRHGIAGEANSIVPFLDKVYRGVDILITPHHIATRIIREALASGLPCVAGTGCMYTPYTADPRSPDIYAERINRCWEDLKADKQRLKLKAREIAEQNFNYDLAGKAMLTLCNDILDKEKSKPVFVPIEWSGWTLAPTDWIVLRDIIKGYGIVSVIEFGAGTSTQLMDREGLRVLSYETSPEHIEKVKRLVSKAEIVLWDGIYPPIIDDNYQLALIDGPCGGESREPAYKAVANSKIKYVACHDYKREEDKVWIDKYFSTWSKIAKADQSTQGLLIFKRG